MTTAFEVSIHIKAPPHAVWHDVADITSHLEWMDDAGAIEFTGSKRQGVGATFECVTKIGPIRLKDQMLITGWLEERRISVSHEGIVKGAGTFTLEPSRGGTDFTWEESLTFPWYLGDIIGEFFARPLLKKIWRNNLASLKSRIEGPPGVNPRRFFHERGIELIMYEGDDEWSVKLKAPKVKGFVVPDYASGPTPFAARAAAYRRWLAEEEPDTPPH